RMFLLVRRPHSAPTLFPYTTLFRSAHLSAAGRSEELPVSRGQVEVAADLRDAGLRVDRSTRVLKEKALLQVGIGTDDGHPGAGRDRKSTRLNQSRENLVCRLLREKK